MKKGVFLKKLQLIVCGGGKEGLWRRWKLPATRDSPFSVSPSKANLCEIAAKECEQG